LQINDELFAYGLHIFYSNFTFKKTHGAVYQRISN